MNQTYLDVFEITRASLYGEVPCISENPDWEAIYEILGKGKLLGVTNKAVSKITGASSVPADLMRSWNGIVFKLGFAQMCANSEMAQVFSKITAHEIPLAIFKGFAVAELYPEPNMRFSADADIYVPEEYASKASDLLIEYGFTQNETSSKNHVPVFNIENLQANQKLTIELHDRIWEDYEGALIDKLDSMNLTDSSKFVKVKYYNILLDTLGYEEHLIFQIFHMAKHFSFKALDLRYLCDVTLFVNAYKDKFDWDDFRSKLESVKYRKFCDSLFKICVKYLGMCSSVLDPKYSDVGINDNLISDIMTCGAINEHNKLDWESTSLISKYFTHTTKVSDSRISRKISMFFPKPGDLNEKFSYAQKYPILLPFAWIHRSISALCYAKQARKRGVEATNMLIKAEYRISLMHELGITE